PVLDERLAARLGGEEEPGGEQVEIGVPRVELEGARDHRRRARVLARVQRLGGVAGRDVVGRVPLPRLLGRAHIEHARPGARGAAGVAARRLRATRGEERRARRPGETGASPSSAGATTPGGHRLKSSVLWSAGARSPPRVPASSGPARHRRAAFHASMANRTPRAAAIGIPQSSAACRYSFSTWEEVSEPSLRGTKAGSNPPRPTPV